MLIVPGRLVTVSSIAKSGGDVEGFLSESKLMESPSCTIPANSFAVVLDDKISQHPGRWAGWKFAKLLTCVGIVWVDTLDVCSVIL